MEAVPYSGYCSLTSILFSLLSSHFHSCQSLQCLHHCAPPLVSHRRRCGSLSVSIFIWSICIVSVPFYFLNIPQWLWAQNSMSGSSCMPIPAGNTTSFCLEWGRAVGTSCGNHHLFLTAAPCQMWAWHQDPDLYPSDSSVGWKITFIYVCAYVYLHPICMHTHAHTSLNIYLCIYNSI